MKARLAKKGAPSKEVRMLLANFNDWIDNASAEDKIRFGIDYSSVEDIRDAYAQATGSKVDIKTADSFEKGDYFDEAKVESFKVNDSIPEPDGFDFNFDPNAQQVSEKPYAKDVTDPNMHETIGEPIFSTERTQPVAEGGSPEQPQADAPTENGFSSETQAPQDPMAGISNPAMNDLDDKSKKVAATQFVDLVLGLYDNLHQWVKPALKVKEKKIIELEAKGLIDPTDTLQVDEHGTQITARQLVHSTNESIDDALTPDPSFNGKVREPMIREFSKRGWGLTDMQYIAMMFAQDAATKGAMIVGARRQMNSILEIYKEKQAERKSYENENVTRVEPDSIRMETQEAQPVTEAEQVY